MRRCLIVILATLAAGLGGCAGLNRPPSGYAALFNGRDLDGWQGLIEPPARRSMPPDQLARAQAAADERMREHWRVDRGVLRFDGRGENLCTREAFRDFELLVDWRITPGGDSGIYLRGTPQVQIWDNPAGSGGLYNNQRHRATPLAVADRPPGEWNRFRIRMIGERVSVWLNGALVVDDTPMENYWERGTPIDPEGPIELQSHGSVLEFRNIFVRRLETPGQ